MPLVHSGHVVGPAPLATDRAPLAVAETGAPGGGDGLLLETGGTDNVLLETGDNLLLE